jgi:AcrR family transcriptional regulator
MLDTLPERESRQIRRVRETRRRILKAALDMFAERGVDAVTVDEIAERADCARGTVFNHFSTKEALCEGLGEIQTEMLLTAVKEGKIQGKTVSEKIEQALRLLAELPGRDPDSCRDMLVRVLRAARVGEMPEHRRQIFEQLVTWAEEGQSTGEFRADIPPCRLACFIMGLQLQATIVWSYGLIEGTLADNVTQILRLGLEGMRART